MGYTGHVTLCDFLSSQPPAFIPPDQWPPNSTDLNLVDYKICGDVQQRVHQSLPHSVDKLKKRLQKAAQNKYDKYTRLSNTHIFYPFAIETAGT